MKPLLLPTLLLVFFASIANAQLANGIHEGSFVCENGVAKIAVLIYQSSAGIYDGELEFYATVGNSVKLVGVKSIAGKATAGNNEIILQVGDWINLPKIRIPNKLINYERDHPGGAFNYIKTLAIQKNTYNDALQCRIANTRCEAFMLTYNQADSPAFISRIKEKNASFTNASVNYKDADNDEERILAILKWSKRYTDEFTNNNEYKTIHSRGIQLLFTDQTFTPFFGKPLDELTYHQAEWAGRKLISGDHRIKWQREVLSRAFQEVTKKETSDLIKEIRVLRFRYDEFKKELENFSQNYSQISLNDLKAYKKKTVQKYAYIWPSDLKLLTDQIDNNMSAAAERTLATMVTQAIQEARTIEDAKRLKGFFSLHKEIYTLSGAAMRKKYYDLITEKFNTIVESEVAKEKALLTSVFAQSTPFPAANQWYDSFGRRFNDIGFVSSAVDKARNEFLDLYEKRLIEHKQKITAEILSAKTAAELQELDDYYFHILVSNPDLANILSSLHSKQNQLKQEEEAKKILAELESLKKMLDEKTPTGEPTQAQMRWAFANRLGLITDTQKRFLAPGNRANPMSSFGLLTKALMGDWQVSLDYFEKISCEKAIGKPGFVCDCALSYNYKSNAGIGGAASEILNFFTSGSGLAEKKTVRFVKVNDERHWVIFDN